MRETYTFKVAPEYTIAHGGRGDHFVCLEEWSDRTVEEFAAGMAQRVGRWLHRVERHTIGGRAIEEHTWERIG